MFTLLHLVAFALQSSICFYLMILKQIYPQDIIMFHIEKKRIIFNGNVILLYILKYQIFSYGKYEKMLTWKTAGSFTLIFSKFYISSNITICINVKMFYIIKFQKFHITKIQIFYVENNRYCANGNAQSFIFWNIRIYNDGILRIFYGINYTIFYNV